jgi:putative RNA 2'-phosphotransferase
MTTQPKPLTHREISKFLSHVLRHAPETIGISLDANGWVDIADLLSKSKKAGKRFDRATLELVVAENDKQRFTICDQGLKIRAAQGHSVAIELGLAPQEPPAVLYHGTASHNLPSIFGNGIRSGRRQKVHLSSDEETAVSVGRRHGKPVVLRVKTGEMYQDGQFFWRADNGVWLCDHVQPKYLGF